MKPINALSTQPGWQEGALLLVQGDVKEQEHTSSANNEDENAVCMVAGGNSGKKLIKRVRIDATEVMFIVCSMQNSSLLSSS